jgi:hypothetical protein
MDGIEKKIKNSNLLTQFYGRWPSFHDAEVVSFELFRDAINLSEPNIRAKIHVHEMTSEVDQHGFFVLKNHKNAVFLFTGIDECSVSGFNQQNVLMDLAIIDISSRQLESLQFEIHFSSSFGIEASFKCREIKVEGIENHTSGIADKFSRQAGVKPGEFTPDS